MSFAASLILYNSRGYSPCESSTAYGSEGHNAQFSAEQALDTATDTLQPQTHRKGRLNVKDPLPMLIMTKRTSKLSSNRVK